jgi:hypothetical protein
MNSSNNMSSQAYEVEFPNDAVSRLEQPTKSTLFPLLTGPVGYADEFYPEKVVSFHKTPSSKRLLLETALLYDLIESNAIQIRDITVLSSFRKQA